MDNDKNKEHFLKLVVESQSSLLEKLQWRKDNEYWLKKSEAIAMKLLRTMRSKGINQKTLAEKMGVSPQYINKLLKGQENCSIQTIGKLEQVLETELIEIATNNVSMTHPIT